MNLPVILYLFPMTAVISLVYSASRFEETNAILRKAVRLFMQITVFMFGVMLLLYMLTVGL